MINFSIPANFSKQSIELYASHNSAIKGRKISEVFGALNPSEFSSGRLSDDVPEINLSELKSYIAELHKNDMEFNYTFNSSCLGGEAISFKGINKIIVFVEKLVEVGIDSITLAIPPLFQILRRYFPELKKVASVICRIHSADKIDIYKEWGATRINLWEDVSRDFKTLSDIAKNTSIDLELMVNSGCTYACPVRDYHYNFIAHDNTGAKRNWIMQNCLKNKTNPANIIKARGWIRPRDIDIYKNYNISYFKIIDRASSKQVIDNLAYAYMFNENYNKLFPQEGLFKSVYEMNFNELDGYLDFFVQQKNKCTLSCVHCGYCEKFATKAIKVNQQQLIKKQEKLDEEIDEFLSFGTYIDMEEIDNNFCPI